MQHQDSLASVTKKLMFEEPFYGLFLIGLDKVFTSKNNPTACVGLKGINYFLNINPDYWDSLPDVNRQKGLVKHELLHIGFFHVTDFKHLSGPNGEYHEIANIAMDIEINQYIDKQWRMDSWITLDSFPELNLEPNQGTHYYYDKLKEAAEKNNPNVCAAIAGMRGADPSAGKTEIELPNGTKIEVPNHAWEEFENMDEATQTLVKAQIGHMVESLAEQVEKLRGTVPGEFTGILERLRHLDPPKFDWKGYMRRFIGKSTEIYTKRTRRKPNKRLPDMPGLKIKQHKHVLVAVDTSGSVSDHELRSFFNEIYHIEKTGCRVTLMEFDSAIAYLGKFDPKKDIPLEGRGGTDFQPPIDYYNDNRGTYNTMFIFTDGYAPSPQHGGGNLLWVITEDGTINEDLPGPVIQLN